MNVLNGLANYWAQLCLHSQSHAPKAARTFTLNTFRICKLAMMMNRPTHTLVEFHSKIHLRGPQFKRVINHSKDRSFLYTRKPTLYIPGAASVPASLSASNRSPKMGRLIRLKHISCGWKIVGNGYSTRNGIGDGWGTPPLQLSNEYMN